MVAFLLLTVVLLATISNAVVVSEPCTVPGRLRYMTREASIQQNKSIRRLRKDLEIHKKQVHPRPPLLNFSHDNDVEEDSVSMSAQDVTMSVNTLDDKTDEGEGSVSMSMLMVSNYMIENTLANDEYIISMSIVLDIERDVIPTRVQFTRRHMDWEEEPI